jgi:hypothetical protein
VHRDLRKIPKTQSPNYLVGPTKRSIWDAQSQRLGGPEVDNQLELCRLLDGNIAGSSTSQNLVYVFGDAPVLCADVDAVRDQASIRGEL